MTVEIKDEHILVTGFAQLPKGTPVYEVQKMIGCILLVDTESDTIVEATFTFLQDLTNNFLGGLLQGKSIKEIEPIIKELERRFIAPPQRAVIQGLIAAKKNYDEAKEKM